MIKLKDSKFELLAEDILSRFQSAGLLSGDIVKFRKNALNNPTIKGLDESYKQYLKELMESDLLLKVGAVRTVRPNQQYNMANTIFGYSVDVVQETAPGLFRNPITVPIEVLERVDTGNDRQPVPDSLRRKERINIKPEEAPKFTSQNKVLKEAFEVRPDYVVDEHLEFLDRLRESGVTNMYGARPYVMDEFGLEKEEASKILIYWMSTFGKPDR